MHKKDERVNNICATDMFCYQCEQTAKGKGCTKIGVCGKNAKVAALQDLLIYCLIGLSEVAVEGRKHGVEDHDADVFTVKALFTTLTNVNFDEASFAGVRQPLPWNCGRRLKSWVRNACGTGTVCRRPGQLQAGERPERPDRAGHEGRAEVRRVRGRREHQVAAARNAVRHQGRRRLCGPRADPRPGGRKGLRLHPRGPRRDAEPEARPERLGRSRAEVRRDQHPGDGTARRRQHRHLRPPDPSPRCRSAQRRARPS